ncbi:hypothetical protein D3C84_825610 [compost metagenome]
MSEIIAIAVPRNDIPRQRIRFSACHAGTNIRERMELSFQHDAVYFPMTLRSLSDNDRAGQVRTIALVIGAKIELDELVRSDDPLACHTVRQRRSLARSDDRLEGRSRSASLAHERLHLQGDFQFGNARANNA